MTQLQHDAATAAGQPYEYQRRTLVEPDWTRFPGWRDVTAKQWESASTASRTSSSSAP